MFTTVLDDEERQGQVSSMPTTSNETCFWMDVFEPAGLNDHNIPRDEENFV